MNKILIGAGICALGLLHTFLLSQVDNMYDITKLIVLLTFFTFTTGYVLYTVRDVWNVKNVLGITFCLVLGIFTITAWVLTIPEIFSLIKAL